MAAYTVRILKAASRELEKLDKSAGRRVIDRIRWLAENAGEAKLQALKGDLSGLYKLREGDFTASFTRLSAKRTSSSFTVLVTAEKFTKEGSSH